MKDEAAESSLKLAVSEELSARDRVTYLAWGQGLSLEAFLAREESLRSTPWAREAMRSWFLRDADGQVLSSCETFASPAHADDRAGHLQAVASVFTEPRLRGRGLATRLIDLLCARLEREPGHLATTLYSDVGHALYARSGFATRPSGSREWSARPAPIDDGVRLLSRPELARALPEVAPSPAPRELHAWPSPVQLDWHLEREDIYRSAASAAPPPASGARRGDSLIAWSIDYNKGYLQILLLTARDPADASALIAQARAAAARAGLARASAWESEPFGAWDRLDQPGTSVARADSLPMIRPAAPGLRAEAWRTITRGAWV